MQVAVELMDKELERAVKETTLAYEKELIDKAKDSFLQLADVIKNKSSITVQNPELNDVVFDYGDFGDLASKNGTDGNGMIHIIQRRSEIDNLSEQDIASLLFKIKEISETTKPTGYDNTNTRAFINKDGIRVILQKNWKENERNWLVTGYGIIDSDSKKLSVEATETIKTVNAQYGYKPEHSRLREQVGAVIASISNIRQEQQKVKDLKKNTKIEKGTKIISTSNPNTVYSRAVLQSIPRNCNDKTLITALVAANYAKAALESKITSKLFLNTKKRILLEKAADENHIQDIEKELKKRGYSFSINNFDNQTSINYQRIMVYDISNGKEIRLNEQDISSKEDKSEKREETLDNGIEQVQSNGGMSEAAMEADIAAQEEQFVNEPEVQEEPEVMFYDSNNNPYYPQTV